MRCAAVFTQVTNGIADGMLCGVEVGEYQYWLMLFSRPFKDGTIVDYLYAPADVLEPVHQLRARQQFLVEQQSQRLRHARDRVRRARSIAKSFRSVG